ncbi:hypothetical protein LINPERHAP1_LOCUS4718 [Linum perenne]
MRIRVMIDVTRTLKRGKKLRNPGQPWIMCKFKYERLPLFCYICGRISHLDRLCEIRFANPDVDPPRLWDASLRAPPRRNPNLGGERWLIDRSKEEEEHIRGARDCQLPNRESRQIYWPSKGTLLQIYWIQDIKQ